jgi:hypothetical protein
MNIKDKFELTFYTLAILIFPFPITLIALPIKWCIIVSLIWDLFWIIFIVANFIYYKELDKRGKRLNELRKKENRTNYEDKELDELEYLAALDDDATHGLDLF